MPVLKIKNNGVWEQVSGIPDHTHVIDDITDFPTSLPANGGNADTVDGKHASDFASAAEMTTVQNNINDINTMLDGIEIPTTLPNPKAITFTGAVNASYDGSSEVIVGIPGALSELSEDTTHRVVTDTEKAKWNAKSNFSGSYNDLTDKPAIPDVPVQSVNGKTGAVVLSAEDVAHFLVVR